MSLIPTPMKTPFAATLCALALCTAPYALAQRDLKNIPDPDPELERKSFIVAEGFEVNLFSADPQIAKPIQMNFDERGRLWIAGSELYPHIKPGEKANDKILMVEDTTGDGVADKTTVFADGLLIPTGIAPGDGGCYVANSTELIHLADTDGDGKADRRRVVLSGFGTEDTHHLLHTLRWGPDGQLYMNQSIYIHSHVETPYGVRRLNGGGIWQFRPETQRLEIFCYGFVNPWGHHFDRFGQSFATDGAYGEGVNYVFPGSVFVTAPGAKRIVAGLNPGSPKHCGLEIASGRHLPPEWSGNMLTNDFRAHRVCRFVVTEDGSGYASRQETELIKTQHVAFRPIDVKMGPDGAIYVADWYNPIIQHGEVDFRDPRRDHVRGRIWRVSAKGRPVLKLPNLVEQKTPDLLEQLKAPEDWVRLNAKLVLKSRGAPEALEPLAAWIAKLDPASPDYEHQRLEGLWAYQTLDHVAPALLAELLASPDHRVRAAAVRVASQWQDRLENAPLLFAAAVKDEHPRVRLEGVRALAQVPSAAAAQSALAALDKPMDRFLDFALWRAMRDLEPHWLPAVKEGRLSFGGNIEHLTFALKAVESPGVVGPLLNLVRENKVPSERVEGVLTLIATLGGPNELGAIFEIVVQPNPAPQPPAEAAATTARKAALLAALVETAGQRRLRPAGDLNRLGTLADAEDASLVAAVAKAVGAWKLESLRGRVAAWASSDDKTSSLVRSAAMDALAALGGPESTAELAKLAAEGRPPQDRKQAINALAGLDTKLAASAAVSLLEKLPEGIEAGDVFAGLLARKGGPEALAAALEGKALKPDVAKLAQRAVRSSSQPSESLLAAIAKAGGLAATPWKPTLEEFQEILADVAVKGHAGRGEAVYRRASLSCQKCHAIGGAGGLVGPDLVSIGASAPVDYLLESLIEPNKKIKENYHSLIVSTDEGQVLTGVLVRESKTELVLRDAEDREIVIPAAAIESRKDGRSLMPDGAIDQLTRAELVDLTRFLSELGKVGEFAIGKTRYVRRWQSLVWTPEAHGRLNRTSFDSAANETDTAFTWGPAYSLVSGELRLEELAEFEPHRGLDKASFVRFQIDVTTPGRIRLLLNSSQGLSLWVDGKPTSIAPETTFDLAQGRRSFTLAINRKERNEPLRVELADAADSKAQAQIVGGK